jgi:hypothetical protein
MISSGHGKGPKRRLAAFWPATRCRFGLALIALCITGTSCSEQPVNPAQTAAAAPDQKPATPVQTAILPDEIRAQLPAGASLRQLIAGKGAVISPGETRDSHQRHAYDLPAGAAGIVAVVSWTDAAWKDVEIAVGIGLCPHRGRKLASARGSNGVAALHHAVQADEALAEDSWFLHVNADASNPANPGKPLDYTYAVYYY